MKSVLKLLIGFSLIVLWQSNLLAQKVGHIYSEEILKQMPEYQSAVEEIDLLTNNWEKEILSKQKELEKIKHDYFSEKPMLTMSMAEEKLKQIDELESKLREFQNKRFGYKGMLFLKKEQLLDPIKVKMAQAVERVCKIKKVDFIFDLSSDMVLPHANKSRNYTNQVLEQLGIVTK